MINSALFRSLVSTLISFFIKYYTGAHDIIPTRDKHKGKNGFHSDNNPYESGCWCTENLARVPNEIV